MQLNAGISIVLHFTIDVGQCLFSPFFLPSAFSLFLVPLPLFYFIFFFVWSCEMKMIITDYVSKKLIKA